MSTYIQPLFRTLGEVGYRGCKHPRKLDNWCLDCGELWSRSNPSLVLSPGRMDFVRRPIKLTL